MRAIPIIVTAIGVSLLYLLARWAIVYTSQGIIRPPNTWVIEFAVAGGGAVALWLAALIAVVFCVRAALRRNFPQSAAYCVAVAAWVSVPLIGGLPVAAVKHRAELRDLERVGIDNLHAEVAALIAAPSAKSDPYGRLGRIVPPAELPPALQRLSAHAGPIEVSDRSVGFITDGLGSWRGTYIITPPNSTCVPQGAREVAEGVYYVIGR